MRQSLLLGITAALALLSASGPAQAAAVPVGPGSLSGVWVNSDYPGGQEADPNLHVRRDVDGNLPPLQPWAEALLKQRMRDALDGRPYANPKSQCLPSGVPAMMFGPGLPIQILETPGQVTILNEELTYFRIIRLDVPHRQDPDPSYTGDSVGRWEGDTLVVDTIALTDKTTLDAPGTPHSDQLRVVERFRRTGPDAIELTVRFEDPKTFTRPWTAITHFRQQPGRGLLEYICENQRNAPVGEVTSMQMPGGR